LGKQGEGLQGGQRQERAKHGIGGVKLVLLGFFGNLIVGDKKLDEVIQGGQLGGKENLG